MKFISLPKNGSSWCNQLPISFDTESGEPEDIILEIISNQATIARRRLYGVTTATIDIAPYLKSYSWLPPAISRSPTLTTSLSAQQVRVLVGGVSSGSMKLFHAPFDIVTPHMISSLAESRRIVRGAPILLSILPTNTLQIVINYISATKTTTTTLSAKSTGLPVELVVPTASIDGAVKSIQLEIFVGSAPLATMTYHIAEDSGTCKQLMWYNGRGGIETYLFPQSIRRSYSATVVGEGGADLSFPARLSEASVGYRLCSAHESPEEMERLSEIVFSPRIFLISEGAITPIAIDCREIIFNSHGTLQQLCLDITEPWKGGVR